MPEYSDDQIREYAHRLWEQAGQPDGKSDAFWHQAKSELQGNLPDPDVDSPKPMPE